MPEGDTIFRAARTLHRALAGHPVTRFESVYPQLTRVHDDAPLVGRIVEQVSSKGKHLLMQFSGDLTLRTHMRMSGSWHIYRPGERWQRPRRDMRVLVATADFEAVGFNIPVAEFARTGRLDRNDALGRLGPDLLGPDFDAVAAAERIAAHPGRQIAEVLLDQRVMAGVGNIFKSETLFVCGVDPFALVSTLTPAAMASIVASAQRLLQANVRPSSREGIATHFDLRGSSPAAAPDDRLWVYGRKGKPCRRCGTPIASRKHGPDARTTYWCPNCQPARKLEGKTP